MRTGEKCPIMDFFPGPYFNAFGLNTERYGKILTRKNSAFGHFSRSGGE